MYYQIGFYLGISIVFFYILSTFNYVVKFINKRYGDRISSNKKLKSVFNSFMRFIVKNHKTFGFFTAIALIAHFSIQYSLYGVSLTGLTAGSILILQVVLGIYGSKSNDKRGFWLKIHRLLAVLLFIVIFIHIY